MKALLLINLPGVPDNDEIQLGIFCLNFLALIRFETAGNNPVGYPWANFVTRPDKFKTPWPVDPEAGAMIYLTPCTNFERAKS